MAKIPERNYFDTLTMSCSEDFTYAVKVLAESLSKNTGTKVKGITFTWAHITDGTGVVLETRMDTERSM